MIRFNRPVKVWDETGAYYRSWVIARKAFRNGLAFVFVPHNCDIENHIELSPVVEIIKSLNQYNPLET